MFASEYERIFRSRTHDALTKITEPIERDNGPRYSLRTKPLNHHHIYIRLANKFPTFLVGNYVPAFFQFKFFIGLIKKMTTSKSIMNSVLFFYNFL